MKSIRTVLVLTSVALIAALHGQEVVPAGTPINQITAIVNPNGEATNVPNGTQVNAQGRTARRSRSMTNPSRPSTTSPRSPRYGIPTLSADPRLSTA